MSQPLAGRVAVVTGATKNIGYATARTLALAGADLVITARTESSLRTVADEISTLCNNQVVTIAGDICNPESVDEVIRATIARFGGADIVVNNALSYIPHAATILDAADIEWDAGFDGYVKAPLRLVRGLLPDMIQRGHGSIINLVSTAAFSIVPTMGVYGTAKAAMWAATRYLAADLAPSVRVNAVCPGTTSSAGIGTSETWQKILPLVPLERMGTPDETARAVLFLASDDSSYTTGQVIFADGGRVALGSAHMS